MTPLSLCKVCKESNIATAFRRLIDVWTSAMLKHTELCIFLCKLVHI